MKGKYAVKAANRLAEIDAGIVAELQEKLARATSERDHARAEVALLKSGLAAEAQRVGSALAAERVAELASELAKEKSARVADRDAYCDQVFKILRDTKARVEVKGYEAIAAVFGSRRDLGGLVLNIYNEGTRSQRRATAKTIRMGEDLRRQRGIDR